MSLTEFTEWLAREMPPGTVISDPRWWAPRIAARLATPQPPKPAGNAIDGLLATARPFLAEEMLLKQGYTWSGSGWVAPVPKPAGDPCAVCKGAGSVGGLLRAPSGDPQDDYEGEVACTACDGSGIKPAGAVPLPELKLLNTDLDGGKVYGYSVEDMRSYVDAREAAAPHALREKLRSCEEALAAAEAREAAGRAVAVPARYFADGPEGYVFADDLKLARNILNAYDHDEDWTITDLHEPAPTPQQPAAEAITYSDQQRIIDLTLSEAYRAGHDGNTFDMLAAQKKINAAFAHHTPASDAGGVTDELDSADQDDHVWELIQIAQECGAVRDEDDDHVWWTLDLRAFYALETRMRDAVSSMRYAALTPEVSHGE